jgi:hypothetical protein
MRRLLLTLGVAGACASELFAAGASAAIPDGSLAARTAVTDSQGVQQAAWVCRGRWHRHCYNTYGGYAPYTYGPYAYGEPYWGGPGISFGFGFGGHRWHHW